MTSISHRIQAATLQAFNRLSKGDRRPLSAVWTHCIPWLVTLAALTYIALTVPWTDEVAQKATPSISSDPVKLLADGEESVAPAANLGTAAGRPGVLTILRKAQWRWLVGYFGCVAASAGLLIIRWRCLLSQPGRGPSLGWCACHWAQSQVISMLPLGQIGGDAYRIARSGQLGLGIARCTGIIVIERTVGFMALAFVACTGWALHALGQERLILLLAAAGLAACTLRLSPRVRLLRLAEVTKDESASWRRALMRIAVPIAEIARQPNQLAWILLLSLGVQTLTPLTFATIDRALGLGTPVWCYLVAVPAVTLVQFLPIHIAGIGILEGGLWIALGKWAHRTPAEILAISSAVRALSLVWMMVLALALVWSRRQSRHAPMVRCAPNAEMAVS